MLPIGATVNMDGTALYQAVAVMFIAQVLNRDLTIAQQFGVFLSAIMVSIGTAGIPGGSIALMPLVLKQAGIGAEYIGCLLYTSDAADELPCVDLGGRRIIQKQQQTQS